MANPHPDAIALLKADHRDVEALFEAFDKARTDIRKITLATEICTALVVHTTIEEEIFYPALRGKIDDDLLDEGYVEHDGAKLLIAELLKGVPGADFYEAKMKVLSEDIEHHVKEEERPGEGMFAQARASDVDLGALGREMAARQSALKAQFKKDGIPAPITRSLIGGELVMGEPVN